MREQKPFTAEQKDAIVAELLVRSQTKPLREQSDEELAMTIRRGRELLPPDWRLPPVEEPEDRNEARKLKHQKVLNAVEKMDGNVRAAALALDLSYTTVYGIMKEAGVKTRGRARARLPLHHEREGQ